MSAGGFRKLRPMRMAVEAVVLLARATLTLAGLLAIIVLPVAALWGYWWWIGGELIDSRPSHPAVGFVLLFLPLIILAAILLKLGDQTTAPPTEDPS